MGNTLTIARREFRSYFNSPTAYIVGALYLLVIGILFWSAFFLQQRASLRGMFHWAYTLGAIAAPALTMALIAEEKRTGTLELLITYPVRDAEVVVGKYLGALGLYSVLLLLTLPHAFSVASLGPLDWGAVTAGYFGLFCSGAGFLAIGVLASSLTSNQLVSLVVGLGICGFFGLIRQFLMFVPTGSASVLEWLSFGYHFDSMERGVIDTRDLLFFVTVILFALGLAFRSLESRRWK